MRRARRHKYLQTSVFFFIYSIIHVVTVANETTKIPENDPTKTESPKNANETRAVQEHHHDILKHLGEHVAVGTGTHHTANSGNIHETLDISSKGTTTKENPKNKNETRAMEEHHHEILKHLGTGVGVGLGVHHTINSGNAHETLNLSSKVCDSSFRVNTMVVLYHSVTFHASFHCPF
ncbi:hypothetical protein JTB14_017268 [Gonioctena quinquepunctata]|nr:hypothetical protein JTB14_017268 [Gonioctena quinquepunctata]